MRPLFATDLLNIWERGLGRTPVEQALTILNVVFPQLPDGVLARLDIIQRDRCLLRLRELTFGSQIKGHVNCPACHDRLELEFSIGNLPGSTFTLSELERMLSLNPEASFCRDDYELIYRLPNSMDLANFKETTNVTAGRQQILEACLLSVHHDHKTIALNELPPEILNAWAEQINQADPLANPTLIATCPTCGHIWEIIFDIVSFFWSEISAWSLRLIREVHTLASAYGWCEADILAMSARRRQSYLEFIGA